MASTNYGIDERDSSIQSDGVESLWNPFSREILPIVILSLSVLLMAVLISCVLDMPLGGCLTLSRMRGRSISRASAFSGKAMPPVVVGLLLYLLLSRSGWLG